MQAAFASPSRQFGKLYYIRRIDESQEFFVKLHKKKQLFAFPFQDTHNSPQRQPCRRLRVCPAPSFFSALRVDAGEKRWYYICYADAYPLRRCGGIGRHKGLKIPRPKKRTGSTPVSGTTKKTTFVRSTNVVFFERSVPLPRNVKYASQVKRTSCVKCAFGTIGGGTLHFTSCAARYFTAASPLLHLAKPSFTKCGVSVSFVK